MNTEAIATLLQQRLGLDPASLGMGVIPSVVRSRMATLGLTSPEAYAQRVQEDAREYQTLLEAVVVPESWFFRGGQLFFYITDAIQQFSNTEIGSYRVLSVPCAAGQEAYSLIIAMEERGLPASSCQLTGIDISPRQVSQAQLGVFTTFSFRELDAGLKKRYFREGVDGWHIRPTLRDRVRFSTGNLVDPHLFLGGLPFHFIFCRNLLIYLHSAARRQVLDTLERLLAPNGLICTGHAEPLAQMDPRFSATGPREHFLYQRTGAAQPMASVWSKPMPRPLPPGTSAPAPSPAPPTKSGLAPIPLGLLQARQLADSNRLDEALRLCRDYQESGEATAAFYSLQGVIHQARHEDAEAALAFQKALYLDPDHREALLHLLLWHQKRGDVDQSARLRQRLDRIKGEGG